MKATTHPHTLRTIELIDEARADARFSVDPLFTELVQRLEMLHGNVTPNTNHETRYRGTLCLVPHRPQRDLPLLHGGA